ncbi:hypothetical protein HRbin30_02323 [bacterium HR30]|nr:hypothetical protein HRbin30_02323 [bacterium HR30]
MRSRTARQDLLGTTQRMCTGRELQRAPIHLQPQPTLLPKQVSTEESKRKLAANHTPLERPPVALRSQRNAAVRSSGRSL